MQKSSEIKVGILTVPVTPELRTIFERTHQKMTGSQPTEEQFSKEEQHEMYIACFHPDPSQEASNFLELIHYLVSEGVPVPAILSKVRCSTTDSTLLYSKSSERSYWVTPRMLSTRLHLQGLEPHNNSELIVDTRSTTPLFIAPKLKVAVA